MGLPTYGKMKKGRRESEEMMEGKEGDKSTCRDDTVSDVQVNIMTVKWIIIS